MGEINMPQDSEKKYRRIFQIIPDVLYELDGNANFTFLSEGIEFFGYDPKELIGKHFSVIIHPEDRERVDSTFVLPRFKGHLTGDEEAPKLFDERRTKERMTKNLEARIQAKVKEGDPNSFYYVEVHAAGIWDTVEKEGKKAFIGVVGIFRNISHRKAFEMTLVEKEESLLRVINSGPDGIVVLDKEKSVLFVNKAAEEIFGKKQGEIKGDYFDLSLQAGKEKEIEIIRENGETRMIEVINADIVWEGIDAIAVSLRDQTENIRTREKLLKYSMTDELTGFNNRRGFKTLCEHQLKISVRKNEIICLLFVDIDNLKKINDSHGHVQGDLALLEVASAIRRTFRESDIISRIGGDEFAILAQVAEYENARLLVKRLEACLDILNIKKEFRFHLSVSVGIVTCEPNDCGQIAQLLDRADKAMYQEKNRKKLK